MTIRECECLKYVEPNKTSRRNSNVVKSYKKLFRLFIKQKPEIPNSMDFQAAKVRVSLWKRKGLIEQEENKKLPYKWNEPMKFRKAKTVFYKSSKNLDKAIEDFSKCESCPFKN